MDNPERYLTRWQTAGLINQETASAILSWEQTQKKPAGRQWQVLVALILGGILLAAGVLLFVAAHWENVSPLTRMTIVLAMLIFIHGLGIAVREIFPSLATALHAVGTVAAGAAIALVGQIFNLQEHWPTAILLWAISAAAGWLLLRDQFQQTLTLLLIPAWIVAEWDDRTSIYTGAGVYLARIGVAIGIVYLVAFLNSRKRTVFGFLYAVGALLLPFCIGDLSQGWGGYAYGYGREYGFLPLSWRLAAVAIILLFIVLGAVRERKTTIPAIVALALAWALPWAQTTVTDPAKFNVQGWAQPAPSLLAYVMVGAAAIFLVAWGVRMAARPLVNYGMVAFACTVVWFYFSDVMDKLGRSLGLIMLGVLFLAGGWLLERTRRRLIGNIAAGDAA